MPGFRLLEGKAHVGYALSREARSAHGVAPHLLGVQVERKNGKVRLLARSLCDRAVEVRDQTEVFDRENPAENTCKRCVAAARRLNGSFPV